MAKIPLKTLIFTIVIFLFAFPTIHAQTNNSSSLIELPSQSNTKDQDLCAETVAPTSCPVKCFRTNPVCGVNGVTFWCGCADAACNGVKVASLGFCDVGSGSSVSLPGQALLLVHIVWLIVLAFSVIFGLF